MRLLADLPVLWNMVFPGRRNGSHRDRMESFYGKQARTYDDFRRRLLHGREEMLSALEFPRDGVWLDMGAGTGANAEMIGDARGRLRAVRQVDLCGPLQEQARERIERNGWTNVETVLADAEEYRADEPADVVTFSYSLTMIPNWFKAVDRALENLKPGGMIGVVDFYVSRKHPASGLRRHRWLPRTAWPVSYAWDDVFLSPDHLPYLDHRFERVRLQEETGRVPYMLGLRSPYYIYAGRKSAGASRAG